MAKIMIGMLNPNILKQTFSIYKSKDFSNPEQIKEIALDDKFKFSLNGLIKQNEIQNIYLYGPKYYTEKIGKEIKEEHPTANVECLSYNKNKKEVVKWNI